MPQTVEAINHAKAANVPMIVAINKCDKPAANPDKVRTDLLQHEVIVEKMSGEVQDVEVSAKTGQGLDNLLEAIALQAEILELKANPDRAAQGAVIEAQLDVGRGPVATVLVQNGTLRQGDIFVVGEQWGKVRAMENDRGERVAEAGPSVPVEVLGLNGTPEAGDVLNVVETALDGQDWIAGDYSIADIALAPWLGALDFYGARDVVGWSDHPRCVAYLDRFLDRPAVQRGMTIPARD